MPISPGLRRVVLEVMHSFRAHPRFAVVVLIALGLTGVIGLMTFLMILLGGFLGMAHFTQPHHRIHDLTYGFLFMTAGVGMLAQLRRPSKNIAGMLMALIPWVGLLLAAVLSMDADVIRSLERTSVAVATVIAVLLHPARREFSRSFNVSRINWVMLVLLAIAAVPLLAFASTNIALQAAVIDEHAALGHYGFMAAFGFTVIGVGLLASLRPAGWRLTAWVAGLLPALLGIASLLYPVGSSLSLPWALAAIAWGGVFVATASLMPDAEATRLRGSEGPVPKEEYRVSPDSGSTSYPGMPRWVMVFVIAVVVLVLAVVIVLFIGGDHTSPVQHGP